MEQVRPKILIMLRPPLLGKAIERLDNQIAPFYEYYTVVLISGEAAQEQLRDYLEQGERYVVAFVSEDLGKGQTADKVKALLYHYPNPPELFMPIEQTEEGPVFPAIAILR